MFKFGKVYFAKCVFVVNSPQFPCIEYSDKHGEYSDKHGIKKMSAMVHLMVLLLSELVHVTKPGQEV